MSVMQNEMRRNHNASGAQDEMVVLVNEANEPLGLAPKSAVHTNETPLHRGFSAFIFDTEGKLLLQQRSASKVTWPLVWSNSVCGHPAEDESAEEAARRRLAHELGLTEVALLDVLPDFRYRAEQDGIVENELCPVLVGVTRQAPVPNPEEVASVEWVEWPVFVQGVESGEADVSPWCREETRLLASMPDLPGILLTLRNDLDEPDIS
jgi:isopentenyl-diphosphate delta-isomerase